MKSSKIPKRINAKREPAAPPKNVLTKEKLQELHTIIKDIRHITKQSVNPLPAKKVQTNAQPLKTETEKSSEKTVEMIIQMSNDILNEIKELDSKLRDVWKLAKSQIGVSNRTANTNNDTVPKDLQSAIDEIKSVLVKQRENMDANPDKKKQVLGISNEKFMQQQELDNLKTEREEILNIIKNERQDIYRTCKEKSKHDTNTSNLIPNMCAALLADACDLKKTKEELETLQKNFWEMEALLLQIPGITPQSATNDKKARNSVQDAKEMITKLRQNITVHNNFRKHVNEHIKSACQHVTSLTGTSKKPGKRFEVKSESHDEDLSEFNNGLVLLVGKIEESTTKSEQKLLNDYFKRHVKEQIKRAGQHVASLTESSKKPGKRFEVNIESQDEDQLEFNKELVVLVGKIEDSTRKCEQKMTLEISQLREENESLQTRLSKIAGSRLTDGNPAITNLGDPNRPMKLGEMFSEMYDNEWTDIMDKCVDFFGKKNNEDKVLQTLYATLIGCYTICIEKWQETFTMAVDVLSVNPNDDQMRSQLKSVARINAEKASDKFLQEMVSQKNPHLIKLLKYKRLDQAIFKKVIWNSEYFAKCLKICWKMITQEPPMVLEEGPEPGKTYDRNVFREYTQSGTTVEFTIWPALRLHKDGPILSKGVLKLK